MDNLGNLTTGAGVATEFDRNYVHQFVTIGDGIAPPAIEGITVQIGGNVQQRINFSGNTDIMEVFSNIIAREVMGVDPAGGNLGFVLPIADGFNPGQSLLLTIVNGAAATPAVRIWSKQKGNKRYVKSGMQNLNPDSSRLYTDFDYLIFDDGNFSYADIVFADGHSEGGMDEVALASLLMTGGPIPGAVDGGTTIAIDNSDRSIAAITIYSTATAGGLTIVNVLAPFR